MDFKKEIIIKKTPQEVWEILGDQYGSAHQWAGGLYHSEGYNAAKIESAPFHNRACDTSQGKIKEAIEVFDSQNYTLVYRVIEGFPFFVKLGRNHWQLIPEGKHTKVKMHLKIQTQGIIGAMMQPMMKLQMNSITRNILDDLKHYVETGQPSPRKAKELAKLKRQVA